MEHHLAQVNVAVPLEPLGSERLRDFVDLLDPVNALADASPGFVWRLRTEDGDATAVRWPGDDRLLVNMSTWESVEALAAFTFGGLHAQVLRRRREWFALVREAYTCAWWVPAGSRPTVAEAHAALEHLERNGPTPRAFTLKRSWPAPGRGAEVLRAENTCPA